MDRYYKCKDGRTLLVLNGRKVNFFDLPKYLRADVGFSPREMSEYVKAITEWIDQQAMDALENKYTSLYSWLRNVI